MFCYLDAKKSRWVPLCACIIGNENSKFKRLNGKWSLGGVILYCIVLYCIVLYCIFATHKIYNNKRDNRKIQEVAREPKKKP